MVVKRMRPIVLVTVSKMRGKLDDKEIAAFQTINAHVTEINGAQLQNNLFGKTYNMTWIARVHGNVKAKYVFFPQAGVANDKVNSRDYLDVIQIRKHATRTDIYFADDREVSSNGLG